MGHITDTQLKHFYLHELGGREEQELFEHCAKCEFCAGRMAAGFPDTELLTPPRGMKEEIIDLAGQIPTRRQRRQEYYRYCTGIAFGMCMAIGLMIGSNFVIGAAGVQGWHNEDIKESASYEAVVEADGRLEYQKKAEEGRRKEQEAREQFLQKKQKENEKLMKDEGQNGWDVFDSLIAKFGKDKKD